MNWKTEIQLIDLGQSERLEVTSMACGHSHCENAYLLAKHYGRRLNILMRWSGCGVAKAEVVAERYG